MPSHEKVEKLRALAIPGLPRYRALAPDEKASDSASVKHLHFIRHGEATHNVQPKPWGEELIDARLTETGQLQASALIEQAAALPIELVITSPLTRALETATRGLVPLQARGVPFVAVEECREQFGQNLPDMRRAISAVALAFPSVNFKSVESRDADELFTSERESLEALSARADRFLDLVCARPETHIAIVTHSSFLAALLNVALDTSSTREASEWFGNAELREKDDLAAMRSKAPGHYPPLLDHNGFEMVQHRLLANNRIDRLHGVQMPANWQQPPRFSTRSSMAESRAASMRPHASFDVDGDGFVGQKDYKVSKKHDLGNSGMLTGGQRDSAVAETCRILGSSLREDEIGGNARARRILTTLREQPELHDPMRREQHLRMGNMTVQTLRNKSSNQLKSCMTFPERQDVAPDGPSYTRTMMLARRRVENIQSEQEGHNRFLRNCGYDVE